MKRGERKNHDGFSSLIKLLMNSITSFETCLSTSQLPSPLSYIKPPANWFRSFVSTFVYTLPSFPSFVVSPFFSFSSLFPSPLLSSSLFYLYPFFFSFFTSRHVFQIYSQHALCSPPPWLDIATFLIFGRNGYTISNLPRTIRV